MMDRVLPNSSADVDRESARRAAEEFAEIKSMRTNGLDG